MKRMLNKTWRSVIALLMVFTMVLGVSSNLCAVVVEAAETDEKVTKETIKYVSLGDSMTNGYGLEGYDGNTGAYDYGYVAYPNQFAEWLVEEGYAKNVEHAQLAMSAMRVEDLHWLLELDYTDDELVALAEMTEWNEELWNETFKTGDFYTWNEFVDDYRFRQAAAFITNDYPEMVTKEQMDVFHNDNANRQSETKVVAEHYQNAIKEADIVSVGIGNGNFGVFMLGRVMEAIGFSGEPQDAMIYNYEQAIAECDAETQAKLRELRASIYTKLGVSPVDEDPEETTKMEALANTLTYVAVSYVLNYAGVLEAIMQLNPDAEVILVGNMNTMAGLDFKVNGEDLDLNTLVDLMFGEGFTEGETPKNMTMTDLMKFIIEPINTYIAALPTYMQAKENSVYANGTFYYAEDPEVECLVETYGEDLYKDGAVRNRFVESIVGSDTEPGMVWGLAGGLVGGLGLGINKLEAITLADIQEYENALKNEDSTELINYIMKSMNNVPGYDLGKMISAAIYLGFEKAVVAGSSDAVIDLNSFLTLASGDLASAFNPIINGLVEPNRDNFKSDKEYKKALATYVAAQETVAGELPTAYEVIAAMAGPILTDSVNAMLASYGATVELEVTPEQIGAFYTAKDDAELTAAATAIAEEATAKIVEAFAPLYKEEAVRTMINGVEDIFAGIAQAGLTVPSAGYYQALNVADASNEEKILAVASDVANGNPVLTAYLVGALTSVGMPEANAEETVAGALSNETLKAGLNLIKDNSVILASEDALNAATLAYMNQMLGTDPTAILVTQIKAELPAMVNSYAGLLALLIAMPEVIDGAAQSDSTLMGLLHLFGRMLIGNGLGAHPSENGHNELADAVITSYKNKYTAQDATKDNLIESVNTLAYLTQKYYDEAYRAAYKYADEAGYIDASIKALEDLKDILAGLDVDSLNLSAELKAELKNAIENAIETIDALIALIEEADLLDQATLDAAIELLNKLGQNITDIREILTQAGIDLGIAIWEAYEYVRPIVIEQLKEAVDMGTKWLMEKLDEAFDAFVETVREALPLVDQYLYDWIYNNPDKVCGFFYEYGDDMGAFIAEHYEAILAVLGYIVYTFGDDALEFVLENPETALKAFVNWYEKYGERVWKMIDRYAEYLGFYDYLEDVKDQLEDAYADAEAVVKAELAKAIAEIEAKLAEIKVLIEEAIKDSMDATEAAILKKLEELGAAVEKLIAMIEAALEEAVSAEFLPLVSSKYVSLGDSSATGNGNSKVKVESYVKRLTKALGLTEDQLVDLAMDDVTIADLFAVVEKNAATIKEADLVTVGLSTNAMLEKAYQDARRVYLFDETVEFDWTELVGKEAAAYIEGKLAEVEAELKAKKELAEFVPMVLTLVESLAYNYVEFALTYPELISNIHALNEDAQVVVVGMYNPMAGVVVEGLDLGEYVEYITRFANISFTAYSFLTPNTVYVSAPDVDTFAMAKEYTAVEFLMGLLAENNIFEKQYATADGHEYIKNQIYDRMDIIELLGDANRDGEVDVFDAVMILDYCVGNVAEPAINLNVCDVDGNGEVDVFDAVMILDYTVGNVTEFPVAA